MFVGLGVGARVGCLVGVRVGKAVGSDVGVFDVKVVGTVDGAFVGAGGVVGGRVPLADTIVRSPENSARGAPKTPAPTCTNSNDCLEASRACGVTFSAGICARAIAPMKLVAGACY